MTRRQFFLTPALQIGPSAAPRSSTQHYLKRIDAIDGKLRAVIERNPDALSHAEALERQGRGRGPLHGAPVLIKDNIATADRMSTTAGSLALIGSRPPRDAFIVERLRQAGAVILGKTNLSEWANFRSVRASSGWSARGGQTRNPYALDRSPAGSSSGSAVAVAADLCAMAVGTETVGSIVAPASMNGIVGLKPTLGLVSRSGIVPIARSFDTAGPMARTVREAALLLGVLAGADPRDPATAAGADRAHPDYTRFLDPRGLRGARLGIPRTFFGFNAAVDRVMNDCISRMRGEGAEIIDPVEFPSPGKYFAPLLPTLLYEFKADLNSYLSALGPAAPIHSLADLIDFNRRHRREEMPWFEQDIFESAEEKGPLTEKSYLDALETVRRLGRAEGIDAAITKDRLDALVAPTAGPAWMIDLVNGDHYTGGCAPPAAVAGYPHLTVPAGFVHGLPVGISFFGPAWSEPALLRIGYAFEQLTRARRPPELLSSIPTSA